MTTGFLSTFDQQRRDEPSATLYWSYGSNLNIRQMARRCPGARKIKPLPVYGAKLVFRGAADVQITDNPADVALGGLWRITRADEDELDRYEGVKSKMYTKEYFYIRNKSRHYHKVLYYKMTSEGIFPPAERYLQSIVQGYVDFGLDMTKLDAAVRQSWDDKNKTEDIRNRYLRDRPPLAQSIEQAKRPMISAPRPKPVRPSISNPNPQAFRQRYQPDQRSNTGVPVRETPKHQPSWPQIGPHSKLLPAPRSANAANPKAPPLESLFPQFDAAPRAEEEPTTRLSGKSNPVVEYTSLAAWQTHAANDGYELTTNGPDHSAFDRTSGLEVGCFNETEQFGYLPKTIPQNTANPEQLPHGED